MTHTEAVDRIAECRAWASSRIAQCRRDEEKFAKILAGCSHRHPPQLLVEAWTERRALEAVLRILNGEETL